MVFLRKYTPHAFCDVKVRLRGDLKVEHLEVLYQMLQG